MHILRDFWLFSSKKIFKTFLHKYCIVIFILKCHFAGKHLQIFSQNFKKISMSNKMVNSITIFNGKFPFFDDFSLKIRIWHKFGTIRDRVWHQTSIFQWPPCILICDQKFKIVWFSPEITWLHQLVSISIGIISNCSLFSLYYDNCSQEFLFLEIMADGDENQFKLDEDPNSPANSPREKKKKDELEFFALIHPFLFVFSEVVNFCIYESFEILILIHF